VPPCGASKNKLDKLDTQPLQSLPSFMSKNAIGPLLVGVLFISAGLNVYYALRFAFSTRDLRRIQPQVAEIQSRLNVAQVLLNDTLEYSKRNPAIDSLLQSLNFKTNAPGAANPGTKLDTK
jgi:hypothetical protein